MQDKTRTPYFLFSIILFYMLNNSAVKAWIEAMRLRTLPVSIAGVLAGTACAIMTRGFKPLPFLICLVFAIVAQIASNFANEYYDFRNGLDKKGRDGFRRGVTEGDLSPVSMKRATYSLLAFDCLLGCSLIIWGGWWLIPIGIAIALFAVGYSTGPYPLSHHGLGDIAVIIFFGIIPVVFTCYLQTGTMEMLPVTLEMGTAAGLLATNVLIVNNYRDADDDRAVNKHTTVVIFGRKVMAIVYLLSFTSAMLLISLATHSYLSPWWIIAWIIMEFFYIFVWRKMKQSRGTELNNVLKQTAKLMLLTCIILIIAALLS